MQQLTSFWAMSISRYFSWGAMCYVCIAIILFCIPAYAGEAVDTAGFSVTFPQGWAVDKTQTTEMPRHVNTNSSPIEYYYGHIVVTNANSTLILSYTAAPSWDVPRAKLDFDNSAGQSIALVRAADGHGSTGAMASTLLRYGGGLTGMESFTPKASTPPFCAVHIVYLTERVVLSYNVDQFSSCEEAIATSQAVRNSIRWKLDTVVLSPNGSIVPESGTAPIIAEVHYSDGDQQTNLMVTNFGTAPALAIAVRLEHYINAGNFETRLRTLDSCKQGLSPLGHGVFWLSRLGPPGRLAMRAVKPTPVAALFADGTTWGAPAEVQALKARHDACDASDVSDK